jgi:TolB protein
MLGDTQPADNPDGLAACKPTSVDATGERVTVPLQTTGVSGDDGSDTADAVVDTATGDVVPMPVSGTVVGAVFSPDGNLLIRTVRAGKKKLSLFAPDGTLLVQATEPAAVKDLDLLAYTR